MVGSCMPAPTLRDTTIEFLGELCEPVGPFVFAGFGGRIARLRQQIYADSGDDLLAGVFRAQAQVEQIMRAWADSTPLPAMFVVLLDLFVAPPPEAGRDPAQWRSELTDLLYMCGLRDRAALAAELAARGDTVAALAEELETWFAEDEAPNQA